MAGNEENNDLSMDMIHLGNIEIPEEIEQQEVNKIDVTDDESQESVGDSTEKSLIEETADSTEKSPANSDDNVFKSLASFLSEKGLLTVQKEEDLKGITTDEEFAELMRKQIKANEYSSLTDHQKKYLEALEKGVPDEIFHNHLKAETAYEQLTDDYIKNNTEVQKGLIIEGWKAKGFDEDYALKQYQRVSNSGESFEESLMFKDLLKDLQDSKYQAEIEAKQKGKKDLENARQQQIEDLKQSVYNKEKIFEDLNVGKGMKEKVYNLMTKAVSYTEEGVPVNALIKHQMDNPVEFQTSLYFLYELTDGFKNIKNLTAKATSKAINTFKSKLQKSNFIQSSANNPSINEEVPEIPIITDIID